MSGSVRNMDHRSQDGSPTRPGTGPVTDRLGDRSPFGAIELLEHEGLVAAQRETLRTPRRRPSLSAQALFTVMDLVYH